MAVVEDVDAKRKENFPSGRLTCATVDIVYEKLRNIRKLLAEGTEAFIKLFPRDVRSTRLLLLIFKKSLKTCL